MTDYITALVAVWPLIAACVALLTLGVFLAWVLDDERKHVAADTTQRDDIPGATFGPWSDHAHGCRCNVCW